MSRLGKKTERVLVILGATAAMVIGVLVWYRTRQATLDQVASEARRSGRAALEASDYEGALSGLGAYLQRFEGRGASAQDYVLYAKARSHVPDPKGGHVFEAISVLQRALGMDPANAEAKADLLALYEQAGYATEALGLIDGLLAASPDDLVLLRKKFEILASLRQFAKAIDVGKEINRRDPDDLKGYLRTLAVLVAAEQPQTAIEEWADAAVSSHLGEPRFGLLRAAVISVRRDPGAVKEAGAALDRILAGTEFTKDATFVELLVGQLDSACRFADTLRVLERSEPALTPALRLELLRRLYYSGRPKDVLASIDRFGGDAASADPEVLALRALTLVAAGRTGECGAVREELARRLDPIAGAWSALVVHATPGERRSAKDDSDALRAAVRVVPDSALHRQVYGDVTAELGDPDGAIEAWTAAATHAPSWSYPLKRIARALLGTPGGEARALAAAEAAYRRTPDDLDTISVLVQSMAADTVGIGDRKREDLLNVIGKLQEDAPEPVTELLPLQIGLLARSDKVEAEKRLRVVLASKTAATEATLLRLARVAQQAGIPLESACLDLSEAVHGVTPSLALYRAVAACRTEGPDAGLRTLDGLRSRGRADTPPTDWDVVRATYLDSVRRREAGVAWIALADANADTLRLQLGALASESVWQDHRDAVVRIIDRVRALTGDDGTTWRIARARWLLSAPQSDTAHAAEAAQILTDVCHAAPKSLSARMLLAQALEQLNNLPSAEEQLEIAAGLSSGNTWIDLELAQLEQRQGHVDASRRHLDQALQSTDLAPASRERAAYLLAIQGDLRRGAELLEPITSLPEAHREGVLLLAQLYAKLGQTERALALCQRLLARPDSEILRFAADLYATSGRAAEADVLLSQLDQMNLRPGDRELIRAKHAARWDAGSANRWFRMALDADPARADAWISYLNYLTGVGDAETLAAVVDDPRAVAVEACRYLIANRELCVAAARDPRLRPLLRDAIADPASRPALTDAMRATVRDWPDPSKRESVARDLRTAAERSPRLLSLRLLAAELSAQAGDLRSGCDLARTTMMQFPDSAAAAWQASEMLAKCGRWSDALDAGLVWRDRVGHYDPRPELFVARAMIRLGRVGDAAAALELQLRNARANPIENMELLLTYAVTLVRTGRAARAADMLSELAHANERWRTAPLSVLPRWLGDARTATEWLKICAVNAPEGDQGIVALARAWASAWEEFGTPELLAGALAQLDRLSASPNAPTEALFIRASLQQQQGDLESARRGFAEALAKDPANVSARNNLAVVQADLGHPAEAVDEATRVVQAAPKSPEALDTLAYALRTAGRLDESVARLEEAVRLDPGNPAWHLSLAETLAKAGRPDRVAQEVERTRALMESSGADAPHSVRTRLERISASQR